MTPAAPAALLLAKATLVLVAALGVTRVLQRAPAGARHLVWLATLGALLLVPALATWAPLRLAVLPAPAALGTPPGAPARPAAEPAPAWAAAPATPDAPPPAATPAAGVAASAARALPDAATALVALWAAVALAIGASLVRAWLAVRRIVRRARPLDAPAWRDPLYEVADRLGLDEPPRLLRSDDTKMPFACGLRRPTIVLPADSDGWTDDRRRAVLLHELAHVRRRDLAGHTLARVVCAAYWFHPLVWTAARRLRAESERACDDLALACGARAADYAEHLLDIVTAARRDATPVVALAMARRNEFEGRMLDILDPERPRAAPTRLQRTALVGAFAALTVVVGAVTPAPAVATRAATRPAADAAGADARWPRPAGGRTATNALAARSADTAQPGASLAARVAAQVAAQMATRPTTQPAERVEEATAEATAETTAEVIVDVTAEARAGDDVADARRVRAAAPVAATLRALVERAASRGQASGGDERAELLARVLRGDTSASLRRIAAWGLAEHSGAPAAAAALAAAVRADRDPEVREMAAWALGDERPDAAGRDALAAALRGDAEARVRATAAWALGNAGDRSAADVLAAALRDPSPDVRMRAAWALGNVEARQAPPALVALLGDREPRVRKLAAWALFNIEDPAAASALQGALRVEQDPGLQVAYVRALGALGERSVDALRGLLESPDARLRSVAVRALAGGHAGDPWPWPWPQPRPHP